VSVLFNFQGPAVLSRLRDSLYIIYQKRLLVKWFSESFLKNFFFKKRAQAVDRRACRGFRRGTACLL
ncbi:hypothetical protein, partial [Gemmiger sp.]|uniref:hypothetical protein n=1 Tax=Gemmiger sp. TaxID=2049027 RepID=UPI002E79C9D2